MNTWPGGHQHGMLPSEHIAWNAQHYPGTRQLCDRCGDPTGRCEDDSLFVYDETGDVREGPLCETCWEELCPEEDR